MKIPKITLLLASLFISTIAFSQIEKGAMTLGGSLTASVRIEKNSNNFSISPNISGGYFLSDNFLLKNNLSYSYSFYNFDDGINTYDRKQTSFGIGTGIRYYWNNNRIQPFVGAYTDFFFSKSTLNTWNNSKGLIPKIDFGVNYFINENVSLEFQIPVSYYILLGSSFQPPFDARRLNINPGIGFQIFLTKPQNDEL